MRSNTATLVSSADEGVGAREILLSQIRLRRVRRPARRCGPHGRSWEAARQDCLASRNPKESCLICLEEFDAGATMGCGACGQHTCSGCIESFIRVKLKDADVAAHRLVCPSSACTHRLSRAELSQRLPTDLFTALREKQDRLVFESHPDVRWCPHKECRAATKGVPIPGKSEIERRLRCSGCAKDMCFNCAQPFHGGKCTASKEDKKFIKWAESEGQQMRRCPGCRIFIQKTTGCDHMTCRRCRGEFCWKCGEPYIGGLHQCEAYLNRGVPSPVRPGNRSTSDRIKLAGIILAAPIGVALSPFIATYIGVNRYRSWRRAKRRRNQMYGRGPTQASAHLRAQWRRENAGRMREAQRREAQLQAASLA